MTFSIARAAIALVTFFVLAADALANASVLPPAESDLEERLQWMVPANVRADYLPEIKKAMSAGQFAAAEKMASEVIAGPVAVANPQREAYLHSLAYLRRAEARRALGVADAAVNSDIQSAALLGNLEAIRKLIEAWTESAGEKGVGAARTPTGVAIEEVLRVGLDLDEVAALKAAAEGYGRYSSVEREAFSLRFQLSARDSGFIGRLRRFMKLPGASEYMRTNFLVGGEISASGEIPGRDALATFFSESNLRSTMARGLGFALPPERPAHEPSLRELMEMNSWLGDMSGLTTVLHFTSAEPGISAPHVVLDPQRLSSVIMAGNTINVRCGGIAHTAVVVQVDVVRDEIILTDPLYEFWKPENNACITSFSLKHYKYGYHVTVLKLGEVLGILDSVQSFRTFSPPGFVFAAAPNGLPTISAGGSPAQCRPANLSDAAILGQSRESVLKQDLFRWFNFEETGSSDMNGLKVSQFMVRALEFRGHVVLSIRSRGDCIVSASLFLRRSFLEGRQESFATDLMKSFLSGMYGNANLKALQALIAQPAGPSSSGAQALRSTLAGEGDAAAFQAAQFSARFGNAAAENGSRWLRIDVR